MFEINIFIDKIRKNIDFSNKLNYAENSSFKKF